MRPSTEEVVGTDQGQCILPSYAGWLALFAVILLGVLLRLPNLSERSMWFDEALSWQLVQFPTGEMLQTVRAMVHPPLYYLILKGWVNAFGDSLAALRALSVAFGGLTVLGMYLFGREYYAASAVAEDDGCRPTGGRIQRCDRFALFLASLVAINAYQVHAAIDVKMYSLGTALSIFSAWFLLRTVRSEQRVWPWAGYVACVVAFLYTHHYAVLVVGSQAAFLAGYGVYLAASRQFDKALRLAIRTAAAAALTVLLYTPCIWALHDQVQRVRAYYWIQPMTWRSIPEALIKFVIPGHSPNSSAELACAAAVACALLLVASWRARRAEILIVVLAGGPMLAAAIVSLWVPIWDTRYFRFSQLFFLAAAAAAVWRLRPRGLRLCGAGLAYGCLSLGYLGFWAILDVPGRTGMRGAIEGILSHEGPGASVVVLTPVDYFPAKYYGSGRCQVRLLRRSKPFSHYMGGPVIRPSDLIAGQELLTQTGRSYWLIGYAPGMRDDDLFRSCRYSDDFVTEYPYPYHSAILVTRCRYCSEPAVSRTAGGAAR